MTLENDRGNWTHSRRLRESVTAYENDFSRLPEPSLWMAFGAAGAQGAVNAHILNIQRGACQLDLLNGAIEQLLGQTIDPGVETPPAEPILPDVPDFRLGRDGFNWVPWAAAGVLAIGAYGYYRGRRKRPRQQERV